MAKIDNKKIAKNTIALYLRMFVLMLISLYTSRITLEYLGVEDYGIYNLVAGLITVMSFFNNAMALSVNRFLNFSLGKDDIKDTQKIFAMSLNIHILIAIIVILLGETIGLWFVNNKLVIPNDRLFAANIAYQTSIIIFIVNIIKVPYNASIIAHENMSMFAYLGILEGISKLVIVYLLPLIRFDTLSVYAFLIMLMAFVVFMCYYIYAKKHYYESKFILYWDKNTFVSMGKYAGYSTFGNMATAIVNQGQSILLNIFYGPMLNAVRGISLQVNSAVCSFMQSVYTASNPQITQSYAKKDYDSFYSLIQNSTLAGFCLLYIISLPLFLEADFVLNIWLKNVPEYTTIFVRLLLINSIIFYFMTPSIMGIQATGDVSKIHITTGVVNLINLPIVYLIWSIIKTEPYTIIFVQIIISIMMMIASMIIQKVQLNIGVVNYFKKVISKAIWIILTSSPIPILVYYLLQNDNLLNFIIVTCLSVSCAIISSIMIAIPSAKRKNVFEKIISNIRTVITT